MFPVRSRSRHVGRRRSGRFMNTCRLRMAKLSAIPRLPGASTSIAVHPTPAWLNPAAPRSRVSNAVRAVSTLEDHRSTRPGLPFSGATECVPAAGSPTEKSGAGNGSYNQVAAGTDGAGGTEVVVFPADAAAKG